MLFNSAEWAGLPIANGAARKSLSDDLRTVKVRLAVIRRRHLRGDYTGQSVNFVSLIELQSDAHNLAYDFVTKKI